MLACLYLDVAVVAVTHGVYKTVDPGTGAIIAATIAAVALLFTTAATQVLQFRRDGRLARNQLEREGVERQRASYAVQRERLQASFSAILLAATAYSFAAQRLAEGARPGETNDARLQKLGEHVDDAQREIDIACVALLMDGTCSEVLARYHELTQAYTQILMTYNAAGPRNGQPRPDLGAQTQRLEEARERLAEAMRTRLAAMGVSDHSSLIS